MEKNKMTNGVIKEKIKGFLREDFLVEFGGDITEDSDLFKSGVIDSFKYIKLIIYLEKEFGIKFSEEEILANVFVTLTSIADCITKKVGVES